jgi:hypothetical protein
VNPKEIVRRPRRLQASVAIVTLVSVLSVAHLSAWAQQTQPTKPFAVDFDVQVCDGGQFKSGNACEGEPKPGQSADILLTIKQEEGAPLLTAGFLRSSGFKVTPSNEGANNDKVGEGNVKIGVVGLGQVGLLACVVNQNPPEPGDTATLVVALNISSTAPCDPAAALAKVKLRIKSIGESEYEYTLDLAGAAAAAGGTSEFQLTTPVDIAITFFGTSKPNEDISPQTPGGMPTLRFVDEPGSYQFLGHFEGPGGSVSDRQIAYEVINPQPPKKSTNFVPIVVVIVVLIVIAIIAYIAWSRRRAWEGEEDWEYYEDEVYYEEDQYV